jgi:hypothetical protein
MNKDAIVKFIRKNVVGLVCGLVAILCIVATVYPLGDMVSGLQTEADARGLLYSKLTNYIKSRKLPLSDPDKADPGELPGFPTKATIDRGRTANKEWTDAATEMYNRVGEINQQGHGQLVPDELKEGASQKTLFDFAAVYKLVLSTDPEVRGQPDTSVNPLIPADPTLAEYGASNIQNDILHGGFPPTKEQIDAAGNQLWEDVYAPQIIYKENKPTNLEALRAAWNAEKLKLPLKLKGEFARRHKVYVEKDAFTVNQAISPQSTTPSDVIWYAQMQVWIQQDVAQAIAEANGDAKNVLDGEVKRLILIQVPPPPMYLFPPATAGVGGQSGTSNVPAAGTESTAYPPMYSLSPTGRYSNGMYDVVRFDMVVDVDATKVNRFIETLSRNRMITVTGEHEFAVDSDAQSDRGYVYGPGSVVRLELEAEDLFLRKWTKDLMPPKVKAYMTAAPGATPPIPGMMPGGGMPPGIGAPGMGLPPGMGQPGMPPYGR